MKRTLALLMILSACMVTPDRTCPLTMTKTPLAPRPFPIGFDYSSLTPKHQKCFKISLAHWNKALQTKIFELDSIANPDFVASEDSDVRHFKPTEEAVTNTSWMIYGAETVIIAAKMRFNVTSYPSTLDGSPHSVDCVSLTVHELGHSLGLAHNTYDPTSAMWPYLASGQLRREVSPSDVAGYRCQ